MGTTHYRWDTVTDNMFEETDENGDTIATYDYDPFHHGELNSMTRDGQTYYYHYDGEGNVRSVTDENENVVEETTYTAFGEVVSKTSSITNPFGYKGALGYYTNGDTDDIYVRARTYEPTVGRWLSTDPLWFWDGQNLYQYANNSPIGFADPSGLVTVSVDAAKIIPCGGAEIRWNIEQKDDKYDKLVVVQQLCRYGGEVTDCDYRGPTPMPEEASCGCHRGETKLCPEFCFWEYLPMRKVGDVWKLGGGGVDVHDTLPYSDPGCTSTGVRADLHYVAVYKLTPQVAVEIARVFRRKLLVREKRCLKGVPHTDFGFSVDEPEFWKENGRGSEALVDYNTVLIKHWWSCCAGPDQQQTDIAILDAKENLISNKQLSWLENTPQP